MMSPTLVVLVTGVLCALACASLGAFLILRRMAMMTDGISHAILPGLVAGYFFANGPNLLAGAVGATAAAIVMVSLVEALERTRRLDSSAGLGIVFPAMFALGVVLITRFFTNVHLDADAILFGSIEFSFFNRLNIAGRDLGPESVWIMSVLLVMNLAFLAFFYKELKLTSFDPALASALGFSPVAVHYLLMLVLSITTVGAFTAVGAILVLALIIVPAATAYLLTDRLLVMVGGSMAIGALSAAFGYYTAFAVNVSVSGAMASFTGVFFFLAFLLSPSQGVVAGAIQRRRDRQRFSMELLLVHLWNHEQTEYDHAESNVGHVSAALRWSPDRANATIGRAIGRGLIGKDRNSLHLTDAGRTMAQRVMTR